MLLTLWATPRSTSTAFEWMMRQRGDFTCLHEPFNELYYYGEDRQSTRDASVEPKSGHNYASVWRDILERSRQENVFLKDFVYSVKHMIDNEFIDCMAHSFLVRDPRRVIQGLNQYWPDCTLEEVGFESLYWLFEVVAEHTGEIPVVISSDDLLSDPAATTSAYCKAMGIKFIPEALSWNEGERSEVSWYGEGTGPWHDKLRKSTGIKPQKTIYPPLEDDPRLMKLFDQCQPLYSEMLKHRLPVNTPPAD